MNFGDFVARVAERADTTQKGARAVVEATFEEIRKAAMEEGETVSIPGVGTFRAVERAARTARNPRTGEPVQVPARKALVFKASSKLRK